ncbi:NADPH-dependent FMN reductase [Xanthomarina sp. F2636L]|uniref:NADPH-dependent FMN reductase n=1 Tax=Xanthomarina sp. F2636L TaxID=2996018 RepID=UPI00225E5E55|nr:NAD(P)H-dependent oxidoreductase [Xanthomarina sp. F2636L]MCX7549794.1 NAD(P)H-dependent oxidoreductase [Xanthomarina sp. F2636L]
MKKIIAFAGSNSKQSINKQLVTYASSLVDNVEAKVLDLNDFDVPLFGVDLEAKIGFPENAKKLLEAIKNADGIIISLAEHNGAYSSVFKNLFDWMSREEGKLFFGKPMLLMATSTGGRGGQSVLAMAKDRFPRHNAQIVADFSLPLFETNFSDGKITDANLDRELKQQVELFKKSI